MAVHESEHHTAAESESIAAHAQAMKAAANIERNFDLVFSLPAGQMRRQIESRSLCDKLVKALKKSIHISGC